MYPARNSNQPTSQQHANGGRARTSHSTDRSGPTTTQTYPAIEQGANVGHARMPHSTDWAGWSTRQTYAAMASNQTAATRSTPAHVDSNGSPYRSTTHRTIRATVGQGARGLIVEPGAILGAVAGSRVVSDNVADVLAVMNKAIEAEQLDRDRIAEILTDSEGAKIEGVTRAIAGYEIILNKKLEERNNLEETGQWGAGRHNRS